MESREERLKNYILRPNIPLLDPLPEIFPRQMNPRALLNLPESPALTKLAPRRDLMTSEIIDWVEVPVEEVGANAKNSTSMQREPGPQQEWTRGSPMNFPFKPGVKLEDELNDLPELKDFKNINFGLGGPLLTVPPGFDSGYEFEGAQANVNYAHDIFTNPHEVNSESVLKDLESNPDVQQWLNLIKKEEPKKESLLDEKKILEELPDFEQLEEELFKIETELPKDMEPFAINLHINVDSKPDVVLNISEQQTKFHSEWAEMIDISQPVTDFNEKIPSPAKTYPFELDVFQKQAILKLEQRQYVFVAAHTSAGKTVVAEYAIALSQRDLTRTIYTSPIKALSNQKYRDFKKEFKDVGLITGDFQIDPTSSCLIMTTEILRSMLYCGSDIIRDVEYVIFDEVHYINNPERGHVWEEVIILLPEHINIIMLSATVPNAMELADWVGNTKQRKVYVISTLKRPVPLMHYLYTGAGGKSKDDIFLLVDANGNFLQDNYQRAVDKYKDRMKTKPGVNNKSNFVTPKQELNVWTGLIDHMKRHDKMPVVAFTLSRNRCDKNSAALQSVDLNNAREKYAVKSFFMQCLAKLKPPDRELPQVLAMMSSLERGIGVHHSGILPILKEIVEMLFQRGLVKLLFATETFAMGINMPARTVIFDSHRKFDGSEQRNLRPAEYIQMAGRAGRRGHDANGTVILMCKTGIPPAVDLRAMILGKPEKLESHFILRYAVILTCLRIESFKVTDIMKYSFKEFNQQLQIPAHEKQLKLAQNAFKEMPNLSEHAQPLCRFYDAAKTYLKNKEKIMSMLVSQVRVAKEVKVGRVLLISRGRHYNKLAILLALKITPGKPRIYKVLVLDHANRDKEHESVTAERAEIYNKMLALTPQFKKFEPEGINGHAVMDIKAEDIVEITKTNIKVDAEPLIHNWEQRQIERFKDTPLSSAFLKTLSELQQLNENYMQNPAALKFVDIFKEASLLEDNDPQLAVEMLEAWTEIQKLLPHTNFSTFEEDFRQVYDRKSLEGRIEELKFKKSSQNLSLYPQYENKLEVLRTLKYVDGMDDVTLKGKVACEMGQNELLITELILCNIFNDLDPAEIAALLSGLVFQGKKHDEVTVPEHFQKYVKDFELINDKILSTELNCHAISSETEERLNFGLLEVVYEWARNKPFAEIMKLTDVQEGIIVRCIQQLDECIRDVKTAAIRIGNPTLQLKMEDAMNAIRRDIVFTASLYTEL